MTSTPESHALVKLGDFGLSKILDPDSLTSAMSSNVGRLRFKAPEFWNTKADDQGRVKYHRNVDVYAAGLTFAAMIQAQPGRNLVPQAQGSMQSSEKDMPLGLVAHNRLVNKHPDLCVVEHHGSDSLLLKKIKEVIRGMTLISPSDRLSALKVIQKVHQNFSEL